MRSFYTSAFLLVSLARIQAFAPLPPSTSSQRQSISTAPTTSQVSFDNISTSRHYATSVEHPPPGASDFAKRMRNLALPNPPPKNKAISGRPPNVIEVTSLEDYKQVVGEEKDKIVAVRFYAPWCGACKAAAPSFYRVAHSLQDKVKFVDVPVTKESAKLHQGLGIPTIPFAHIYHFEAGLVEELRMSRKRFPVFEDALKSYVTGSCDVSDFDYTDPCEALEDNVGVQP